MSTPVLVDPESSTQVEGAQSSRVPVPLPEDPYKAIRHAYLDGTDTESKPLEDPIDTESPELPLNIAPPTLLAESTPSALVPILHRTVRMDVRVPPAMSSGLSASMAEVAAMSESAFCKRFRSFYDSSPSSSPPDLPLRKHYRGTSELVEDSEEDDDEEDEEIEESLDSDSVSEDAEDEGPTAEDEDPVAGDEGLTASVKSDGFGLEEEEEAVPRGQQQAAPVVGTTVSAPLRLGYGALRHRELALEEDHVYTTFEVRQGSGSALESERPDRVSASRQPTLTIWTDPEDSMVYIYVPTYPPPAPPVQTPLSPKWTSGSLSISPSPSIESRVRVGESRSDIWGDMETSVSPGVMGREKKGLAAGDKGPSMGVESHGLDDKSRGLDDEGHTMSGPLGLGYGAFRRRELALKENHVYSTFEVGQGFGSAPEPERPERVSASRQPTLTTWTDMENGMVYIDVPTYPPPAPPVQTPPSPEWSSGSLSISPAPSIVPSPISSTVMPLTVPSPVATPATAETKGFLIELGAQVEMQGGLIRDHAI
ncbi:hypothetical protein Tco_1493361 [Tanacetum coccineum]